MTLPSFKQFLIDENKVVYFTFGRMNPPTIGHEKLIEELARRAAKNPYRVYLSQTFNEKNPLLYENKLKVVRKFFPKYGRAIVHDPEVNNFLEAASALYDDGFKSAVMVVGSDRVAEFKERLETYNGVKGRHGFYLFETLKVISAGQRDPDAEGIEGASASKLRECAKTNDFVNFAQGLPKNVTNSDAKRLYNDIRVGLGLTEERSFKNHISMGPVSETRDSYIRGELFSVGDDVIIKQANEIATIVMLGTNYVIVETHDGKRLRKWLNDVEQFNEG